MSFAEHAIIWHVYPLGALDAPIRPEAPAPLTHRLPNLINWLDYVVELGCNALLLGPVFASLSHGYDTQDFYRIDPRLGTEEDMDALLQAASKRGIGVLFDGVFNHVSTTSQYAELTTGSSFEGHDILAELDHHNPAVVELVIDVMNHWLDRGIAGWRLDAVYAIDPEFWAQVLPRVREKHPDAWIVGEMIHGDYAEYVNASGIDSVTEYELWKAIWSSIKERNFFELEWTLGRHNEFLETFVPQTFIGNHDVTRIATQIGQSNAILAAAILFTVGGVPSIYYGDEQGFTGIKEENIAGDDAIRPPLPAELSPLGEWIENIYKALIALRRQHPWLYQARTEILDIANETLTYKSTGIEGEELTVHLDLEAVSVRISQGDEELFHYSA
ncbi:amylase [Corynebacterium suranareeae]|uniref:Amylase n=1 Tax=Corynebacterium suranareeae TaxID=2506452 RepID=A0A169RT23_9CORY|nr:alpha-amylase family protein [Corynebacterium suranareeae]BAU95282.1 amylase [Corynebacterium suranareeae]